MRLLRAVLFALLVAGLPALAQACPPDGVAFPIRYKDADLFERGLRDSASVLPAPTRLTGVTVPHHLLAPHLIAAGLRLAADPGISRIILLHPDHFRELDGPFATTSRGFRTVLGDVPPDSDGAAALARAGVPESCLFGQEHGGRALLPFVARLFPGIPVLPVAVSITAGREDWDRLAKALEPLVDDRTLIVQSTDFSHYLRHHEARLRDQQVLNLLAAGNPEALIALRQPDHLDSVGAMYVQSVLQRARGATPIVVANENGAGYGTPDLRETTSYMVIAFAAWPDRAQPMPMFGSETHLIAGDTFLGRSMVRLLLDELAERRVTQALDRLTAGLPLIVNLEGVLLPELPPALDPMVLAMPADLVTRWFDIAGIRAAGLANNHARDIGPSGEAETRAVLSAAGIEVLGQGERLDLGALTVVALSDLGTNASQRRRLITQRLMRSLLVPDAGRAVLAFVHWGKEYQPDPGPREQELAAALSRMGAAIVIGAHPHVASNGVVALAGGDTAMVYSLGNFLFDQSAERASGALAEVRVFPQGTAFVRAFPIPNLYDMARDAASP